MIYTSVIDAAYERFKAFVIGKTIESVEYPASIGFTTRLDFTDGSWIKFNLDAGIIETNYVRNEHHE